MGIFHKLSQLILDYKGDWYIRKFSAFHTKFGDMKPNLRKISNRSNVLNLSNHIRNGLFMEAEDIKCESIMLLCPPALSVLYKANDIKKSDSYVSYINQTEYLQFISMRKLFRKLHDNSSTEQIQNGFIKKIRELVKNDRPVILK